MRIRRVFIANRGEIALRVIRTARRLGIETVLGVSEADAESTAARHADRSMRIGPAPAAQSYLDWRRVVAAAKQSGADAIHPGYGFLSENPILARGCREAGIVFIGATEDQLARTGDKWIAREIAQRAGLPVVPGATVASADAARRALGEIGCPALVKAVGGGGGRGMKRIDRPEDAETTIALAIAEAESAFGDPRIYIERFVGAGRHIEVQIAGDGTNLVHVGERDCSVQRRYQKLIEEAPASGLSDAMREQLRNAAIAFGRALDYRGLGTVEFLVDGETFYFLEMNARIQVEHPVTEAISGIDLVAEQFSLAEGNALLLRQDEIRFGGHAIELRINAEDPAHDFRPSPGRITHCRFPAGPAIRVDTHVEAGTVIPPFYDSLMAKLIVHAPDRAAAIAVAKDALANCDVRGVATNLAVHNAVLSDPEFAKGGVGTNWFGGFWPTNRM